MVAKLGTAEHYQTLLADRENKDKQKDKLIEQKDARIAQLEAALTAAGAEVPAAE